MQTCRFCTSLNGITDQWPRTVPPERLSSIASVGGARAFDGCQETMRSRSITVVGAFLLFTFVALARDHDALNGDWVLVPAKSNFAGQPVVQTGTVTISGRDGIIIVSRSFVYEGATERFFYKDVTDAENNATIHNGKELKSKTRWDRDALQVTTTNAGAVTVETYTLTVDGAMLVRVARPDHSSITLLFERRELGKKFLHP
jgi:hypothetical protein